MTAESVLGQPGSNTTRQYVPRFGEPQQRPASQHKGGGGAQQSPPSVDDQIIWDEMILSDIPYCKEHDHATLDSSLLDTADSPNSVDSLIRQTLAPYRALPLSAAPKMPREADPAWIHARYQSMLRLRSMPGLKATQWSDLEREMAEFWDKKGETVLQAPRIAKSLLPRPRLCSVGTEWESLAPGSSLASHQESSQQGQQPTQQLCSHDNRNLDSTVGFFCSPAPQHAENHSKGRKRRPAAPKPPPCPPPKEPLPAAPAQAPKRKSMHGRGNSLPTSATRASFPRERYSFHRSLDTTTMDVAADEKRYSSRTLSSTTLSMDFSSSGLKIDGLCEPEIRTASRTNGYAKPKLISQPHVLQSGQSSEWSASLSPLMSHSWSLYSNIMPTSESTGSATIYNSTFTLSQSLLDKLATCEKILQSPLDNGLSTKSLPPSPNIPDISGWTLCEVKGVPVGLQTQKELPQSPTKADRPPSSNFSESPDRAGWKRIPCEEANQVHRTQAEQSNRSRTNENLVFFRTVAYGTSDASSSCPSMTHSGLSASPTPPLLDKGPSPPSTRLPQSHCAEFDGTSAHRVTLPNVLLEGTPLSRGSQRNRESSNHDGIKGDGASSVQLEKLREQETIIVRDLAKMERRARQLYDAEALHERQRERDHGTRLTLDAFERSRIETADKARKGKIVADRLELERLCTQLSEDQAECQKRIKAEQERLALEPLTRRDRDAKLREQHEQSERALKQAQQRQVDRVQERLKLEEEVKALLECDGEQPVVAGAGTFQTDGSVVSRCALACMRKILV